MKNFEKPGTKGGGWVYPVVIREGKMEIPAYAGFQIGNPG